MASALQTYRCPACALTVRARAVVEMTHPCPLRRTKAGQPRMTELEKDEDE